LTRQILIEHLLRRNAPAPARVTQHGDFAVGSRALPPFTRTGWPFTCTRWVVLVVAVCVGMLAAWPAVASASLEVTGATIDGVTSTSSPPGGVMEATVTGRASGGDRWRGTQYQFGNNPLNCENTGDTSSTRTVDFDVTAPGDPGTYDTRFWARGANDCGGAESNEKLLQDALRVTKPAPNPNLPPRCGIDVMLVLDESGSIGSSGQTETV
jgi:hypothetical protein